MAERVLVQGGGNHDDEKQQNTTFVKPICYVASPYGFAESTKGFYYDEFLPLIARHADILDPWSVPVGHILQASPDDRPELWTELGQHHLETITNARLVIAGLDQEPPDVGTVAEVAWAAAHNIPVIGYRNDLRTSGEEGMSYNLMVAALIKTCGGVAVRSLVELDRELERIIPTLASRALPVDR